jgi:hypothetical protein
MRHIFLVLTKNKDIVLYILLFFLEISLLSKNLKIAFLRVKYFLPEIGHIAKEFQKV